MRKTQDTQDDPHPQYPPDREDPPYDKDARNVLYTKAAWDSGYPRYSGDAGDARELKNEEEMLDNESDIVSVAALGRAKAEAEIAERAGKGWACLFTVFNITFLL